MANESLWTKATRALMEETREAKEKADKNAAPPFMTEEVRRRDALARLSRMTEGERKEALETMGRDEVLRILKGGP